MGERAAEFRRSRLSEAEVQWMRDEIGRLRRAPAGGPGVVCLCGSTRFRKEYQEAFYRLEHAGKIVLTVPCYKDDPCCKSPDDWDALDRLHRHKIDLADEVFVINVGGYIGDSTRAEIAYAASLGKPVAYLESPGG